MRQRHDEPDATGRPVASGDRERADESQSSRHVPTSDGPTANPTHSEAENSSSRASGAVRPDVFRWISAAFLVFVALAGFAGYQLGRAGDVPAEDGADVGFARDMQTHHNQAVQMALIIRDKTTDPTLRAVAYDIATSQQQQSGQMYGWLAHWGMPMTSSQPSMAWMSAGDHQLESPADRQPPATGPTTAGTATSAASGGHDGMVMGAPVQSSDAGGNQSGSMGMATAAQIRALQGATGIEAERSFLRLMIAHHRGGVTMAQAALRLADQPEVLTLARSIEAAQTAELTQLQQLLKDRS
ncbi:MAG: DUF305 domain-containing protein [Dermatophilaceae bacterium]|nr:DUF305 domain-containing protein [Dermatophilaceae bacterium]